MFLNSNGRPNLSSLACIGGQTGRLYPRDGTGLVLIGGVSAYAHGAHQASI